MEYNEFPSSCDQNEEQINITNNLKKNEKDQQINKYDGVFDLQKYQINQKIFQEKFEIIEEIGNGAFGTVYKAKMKNNGSKKETQLQDNFIAIKEVTLKYLDELEQNIKQEEQFLKLKNKNLIEYYDIFYVKLEAIVDIYQFFVVMEFCESDLEKMIQEKVKEKKAFEKNQLLNYFSQIVNGLDYLHQNKIAHRDLKPNNILIKKQKNGGVVLKLTDFGTVKKQETIQKSVNLDSFQGTILFWPIELDQFSNKANYFKQDIFGLGVTYLMLCAVPNISYDDIKTVRNSHGYDFSQIIKEKCGKIDKIIVEILLKMLDKSYKLRPETQSIIQYLNQTGKQEQVQTECEFKKKTSLDLQKKNENENKKNQQQDSGILKSFFGGIKNIFKKNGFHKHIYKNGNIYEGEWVNNYKEGNGKLTYVNGSYYEGQFKYNEKHGKGSMVYENGDIYDGNWVENKKEGKGKLIFKNGNIYIGEFKNNLYDGFGAFSFCENNNYDEYYEGNYKEGNKNGKGKLYFANGDYYEGNFVNGQMEDQEGKYVFAKDKEIYIGGWKNGARQGKCKIYTNDGQFKFQGEWNQGQFKKLK